jgi:hypothetical protein
MAGALATYARTGGYPHLTVDQKNIEQHCSLDVGATALQNAPGGVETNRLGAMQIELVGFANKIDIETLENLRPLMIWLEKKYGIKAISPTFLRYPDSYGKSRVRLSAGDWQTFDGWLGHQHVPENFHGDPGTIDMAFLLDRGTPQTFTAQPSEDDEVPKPDDIVSEYRWASGAVVRLLRDGSVRCYDTAFYGSINDVATADKINWSSGNGVIVPVDPANSLKGYKVYDWDANFVGGFTPEWWHAHR